MSLWAIVSALATLLVLLGGIAFFALSRAQRQAQEQERTSMWGGAKSSSRPIPPDATAEQAATPPADPRRRLAERLELPRVPFDFVKFWRRFRKKRRLRLGKWTVAWALAVLVLLVGDWTVDTNVSTTFLARAQGHAPIPPSKVHIKHHASKRTKRKIRREDRQARRRYRSVLREFKRRNRLHVHALLWRVLLVPGLVVLAWRLLRKMWRRIRRH
jgi:hypothetical protein